MTKIELDFDGTRIVLITVTLHLNFLSEKAASVLTALNGYELLTKLMDRLMFRSTEGLFL